MMQCEFEERIGKAIASFDYEIVEYVYTNHPSIDEVDGKDQIANIYKIGGMRIIKDMYQTAKVAEKMHDTMIRLNYLRGQIENALCALANGEVVDLDIDEIARKFI